MTFKFIFKVSFDSVSGTWIVLRVRITDTNMQYLQKLQNKGMRIILRCSYRTEIKDMLDALNFMLIKERIKYNVCILIHKMIMGECQII